MKCILHTDLDGHSAGAVVAFATQNYESQDYICWNYSSPIPVDTFADGEEIFIVDCSFGENTVKYLEQMMDKNCSVVWLDHHKTSIDLQNTRGHEWLQRIRGIRDSSQSGVYWAWKWFYKDEEVPKFIQLISDFDNWNKQFLPTSDYFKLGIEYKENGPLAQVFIDLLKNPNGILIDQLITEGMVIKSWVDGDNASYRNNYAYLTEIDGYEAMIVNKRSGSWIFGIFYGKYPISCTYVFDGEKYVYSIFSEDKNVDCSAIAAKYGGGGHRGAAGFTSDKLLFVKKGDLTYA